MGCQVNEVLDRIDGKIGVIVECLDEGDARGKFDNEGGLEKAQGVKREGLQGRGFGSLFGTWARAGRPVEYQLVSAIEGPKSRSSC